MQQYLTQISRCPLFSHINDDDILLTLSLLSVKVVHFEKGAYILHQGTAPRIFGIMLHGQAHVITNNASGNHTLISVLEPSDLFAETFAFSSVSALSFSVVASKDCTVLLIDRSSMSAYRHSDFPAHTILLFNIIRILSGKNLLLSQKINILSQRTTRDKLTAYLLNQQTLAGSSRFTIPLDRQQLADYLCVDRSAMSAELSKMKKAGLIACRKNEFEILTLHHDEQPAQP